MTTSEHWLAVFFVFILCLMHVGHAACWQKWNWNNKQIGGQRRKQQVSLYCISQWRPEWKPMRFAACLRHGMGQRLRRRCDKSNGRKIFGFAFHRFSSIVLICMNDTFLHAIHLLSSQNTQQCSNRNRTRFQFVSDCALATIHTTTPKRQFIHYFFVLSTPEPTTTSSVVLPERVFTLCDG